MSERLTIYVPVPGSMLERVLAPGSGVVGVPREGGVLIHYEGNLYQVEDLREYRVRLMHAAGRLHQNYPTVAKRFVPAEEVARQLVEVGEYDVSTWSARFDPAQLERVSQYAGEEVQP